VERPHSAYLPTEPNNPLRPARYPAERLPVTSRVGGNDPFVDAEEVNVVVREEPATSAAGGRWVLTPGEQWQNFIEKQNDKDQSNRGENKKQ